MQCICNMLKTMRSLLAEHDLNEGLTMVQYLPGRQSDVKMLCYTN